MKINHVLIALLIASVSNLHAQTKELSTNLILQSVPDIFQSVLPVSLANQFNQFDFNWDEVNEVWDSSGVTNVTSVDVGSGMTDVHLNSYEFNEKGSRVPLDRTIFFNMRIDLLANGEISEEDATAVLADSVYSFNYNDETGAFELAFIAYLTPHPNGQLSSFEFFLNGNLNDPPLGLIPFATVNYYYDNEDRLSATSSYFINYYTFQLQLEDSTVFSYNASDLVSQTVSFFSSGDINTTRFAYDNQERLMYEVDEITSSDTLVYRDSTFRAYANATDFQEDSYVYLFSEDAYSRVFFRTFMQIDASTTEEVSYLFDGQGMSFATQSYRESFDDQGRLASTLTQSAFVPGPLQNDEMQIFTYPMKSSTRDLTVDQLDVRVHTLDREGVEFTFDLPVKGRVEMYTPTGVMLRSEQVVGHRHHVQLVGLPAGVLYFRIGTDKGNRTIAFSWKG